jgi:hypothetical protein
MRLLNSHGDSLNNAQPKTLQIEIIAIATNEENYPARQ